MYSHDGFGREKPLGDNWVPEFDSNGKTLTRKERMELASKRGVCEFIRCGVQTHHVISKRPLTHAHAHEGVCILHHPEEVPADVYARYISNYGAANRPIERKIPSRVPPGPIDPPESAAAVASLSTSVLVKSSIRLLPTQELMIVPILPGDEDFTVALSDLTSELSAAGRKDLSSSFDDDDKQKGRNGADGRYAASRDAVIKNQEKAAYCDAAVRKILHREPSENGGFDGFLSQVRQLMEKYPETSAREALCMVGTISRMDNNKKDEATRHGLTKCVINLIKKSTEMNDRNTAETSIATLICLLRTSFNRSYVSNNKGISAVLQALQKFNDVPELWKSSCKALYSVICILNNDNENAIFDQRFIDWDSSGGSVTVIRAMRTHHDDDPVTMRYSIRMLSRYLQSMKDTQALSKMMKKFIEEGFLTVCVRIISAEKSCDDCFRHAIVLLYQLLAENGADTSTAIEECGEISYLCIPACIKRIERGENDTGMWTMCFRLLSLLPKVFDRCKTSIADVNGVAVATTKLSLFTQDHMLTEEIFRFLWVASSDVPSFDYSVMKSLRKSTEKAIARHSCPSIIRSACGLVANLCVSDQVRDPEDLPIDAMSKLTEFGAVTDQSISLMVLQVVARIGSKFPESILSLPGNSFCGRLVKGLTCLDVSVQFQSSKALTFLAENSKEKRDYIASEGVISTASTILGSTQSIPLVCSLFELLSIVSTIFADPEASFSSNQVTQCIIETILESSHNRPECRSHACTVLRNMLNHPDSPKLSIPTADSVLEDAAFIVGNSEAELSDGSAALSLICTISEMGIPLMQTRLIHLLQTLLSFIVIHFGRDTTIDQETYTAASCALTGTLIHTAKNVHALSTDDLEFIREILHQRLWSSPNNRVIKICILDALHEASASMKKEMIQFGLTDVVMECLAHEESHQDVKEKCISVLRLFLATDVIKLHSESSALEFLNPISLILPELPDNPRMLADACSIVSVLCMRVHSISKISSQDFIFRLTTIMRGTSDNLDLLLAACKLATVISFHGEERLISESDLVGAAVATMRNNIDSLPAQDWGLRILKNVSKVGPHIKRIIAEFYLEVIKQAIERFDSRSISRRTFSILKNIKDANCSTLDVKGSFATAISSGLRPYH